MTTETAKRAAGKSVNVFDAMAAPEREFVSPPKGHPIIFSAPMVRALLEGRKTMTRRLLYLERNIRNGIVPASASVLIDHQPPFRASLNRYWSLSGWQRVQPGDRLWVCEVWGVYSGPGIIVGPESPGVVGEDGFRRAVTHLAGRENSARGMYGPPEWKSPIHMPRSASRITLIVTATKIERLQEISGDDAKAEGVIQTNHGPVFLPQIEFMSLWRSLHGPGSWDENPEVVALTFTVRKENIDADEQKKQKQDAPPQRAASESASGHDRRRRET